MFVLLNFVHQLRSKMDWIKIDSDNLNKKSEVHLLPCKIYFNGEASVKSFFSNSILSSDRNMKKESHNNFKTESI